MALPMKDIRRAIELLLSSAPEIDEIAVQPDGSVRLTSFGGDAIHLTIHDFQLAGEPPFIQGAIEELFRTLPEWDEETLRRRALPPEWNRIWLLRELALGGSDAGAAQATRRPEEAIARFREIHGITNPRREYARIAWDSGKFRTRGDLAKHLGISQSILSEYIGRRVEGKKTRVGEDSMLQQIVRQILAERPDLPTAEFEREVVRLARSIGDNRTERKITYTAQRFRQESET